VDGGGRQDGRGQGQTEGGEQGPAADPGGGPGGGGPLAGPVPAVVAPAGDTAATPTLWWREPAMVRAVSWVVMATSWCGELSRVGGRGRANPYSFLGGDLYGQAMT
jgi:hypothetical protein